MPWLFLSSDVSTALPRQIGTFGPTFRRLLGNSGSLLPKPIDRRKPRNRPATILTEKPVRTSERITLSSSLSWQGEKIPQTTTRALSDLTRLRDGDRGKEAQTGRESGLPLQFHVPVCFADEFGPAFDPDLAAGINRLPPRPSGLSPQPHALPAPGYGFLCAYCNPDKQPRSFPRWTGPPENVGLRGRW